MGGGRPHLHELAGWCWQPLIQQHCINSAHPKHGCQQWATVHDKRLPALRPPAFLPRRCRPLVLGKRQGRRGEEWCVASEDCAFGPIGFERVRDVQASPGLGRHRCCLQAAADAAGAPPPLLHSGSLSGSLCVTLLCLYCPVLPMPVLQPGEMIIVDEDGRLHSRQVAPVSRLASPDSCALPLSLPLSL